jgi:transposase-like protein
MHEGTADGEDPKSALARLAMQLIAEEALEAEAREQLGRDYYERGSEGRGQRNGYRTGRFGTAEGEVTYHVPQLRDVPGGFSSKVQPHLRGRSDELERLGVEMYARGLSTRDIERTFRGEDGRSVLSRTAVSEVTEVLWTQYEEFATRDLSDVHPLYMFVDGVAEKLRAGMRPEAILTAWAITWEGKKVLIHVAPGTKESADCVRDFFQDMKRRGLPDPLLIATDGAAGLIKAVEQCFPWSLRQRCLAHRMRNLANKLPEDLRAEFEQAARAAYQAPSPAVARVLRDDLVQRYERVVPAAVACFQEDFDACIAHLLCPPAHRRVTRTTNLLERLFGEERRRMRAVKTMPGGERPVMKLLYASLVRASDEWRGIRITEFEKRQLEALRDELVAKHQQANAPVVKTVRLKDRRKAHPSSSA